MSVDSVLVHAVPGRTPAPANTVVFRYKYFGSLRFLLAMMVVWQHFECVLGPQAVMAATGRLLFGNIAVLVFFCLSGFIITDAINTIYRARAASFLINRTLRIVLPFLVATVFTIAAAYAVSHLTMTDGQPVKAVSIFRIDRTIVPIPNAAYSARNIALNLLSIFPGMSERRMPFLFLTPIWAVRVEFLFYIAMAAFIWISSRAAIRFESVLTFGGVIFAGLFVVLARHGSVGQLIYIPYFLAGVAAFYFNSPAVAGKILLLIAVCLMPFQFVPGFPKDVSNPMECGAIFAFVLLCAIGCSVTRFPAWFRGIDQRLGNLSYYIYLNHAAVGIVFLSLARSLLPPSWAQSYSIFFLACAVSVLWSQVVMYFTEPAIKKLRDGVRGRPI